MTPIPKLFTNGEDGYQNCYYIHPFRVFYNVGTDGKSPKELDYTNESKIPDYITSLSNAFSNAYDVYVNQCKLKSPLKEGIYFNKGAKFIDIMIVDIPVQKGLVAAKLVDNHNFFIHSKVASMEAKSIRILLDRNLIPNTATPIHELFHVFQYNYCNFNNMWFMEGLARWAQNLTHSRKNKKEILPQNIRELAILLERKHDAEYFWRELIHKCDNHNDFVKVLLEQCAIQEKNFRKKESTFEKKSPLNNEYIFAAIIKTIELLAIKPDKELKQFIKAMQEYENRITIPQMQQIFFTVLKKCDANLIVEKNGVLSCDNFDVQTKTLKVSTLICDNLLEHEIDILNQIVHLDGDLSIHASSIHYLHGFNYLKSVKKLSVIHMTNLQSINGFNALENIASLEISHNKKLLEINGFNVLFKNTHKMNGAIKCFRNQSLKSISFLKGVEEVGSSFYLYGNALEDLKGLESLRKVRASMTLASNNLVSLPELSNLTKIHGILNLANNNLKTLFGLENLTSLKPLRWNSENRTLNIEYNKNLDDLSAIENLQVAGKFVFHIDENTQYKTKPKLDSPFYQNNIFIYEVQSEQTISTKVFKQDTYIHKPKILFGDKWQKATTKCLWMKSHHLNFSDIDKVVEYAKQNNIEVLFANNYKTQMEIIKNQDLLRFHKLKFIVNSKTTLKNLVDKQLFYDIMLENNFDKYVPTYYEDKKDVVYPCIVKTKSGGAGRGMFIADNESHLKDVTSEMIMSEYLGSNVEYASSIFSKENKILKTITYSKTSKNDIYILQHENKNDIEVVKCETPFLDIFEKILLVLNPSGDYCQCSINFKVQDGIPKIFEINPRIGYTLAGFPDDFKELMDLYIKELAYE